MEKIGSLVPDDKVEINNVTDEVSLESSEATIRETFQSLRELVKNTEEALKHLDEMENKDIPFLEGLKEGIADSREDIERLASEEKDRLIKRAFELLDTTGEIEIDGFFEKCGLSLEELGLKFPESSKAFNYDDWSRRVVNLETIGGNPSSVTAEVIVHISSEKASNIYTSLDMQLETKPLFERIGPSVEFRINGGHVTDSEYSPSCAVVSFMNTEKIHPNKDFLETKTIGQIVFKPDGSLLSVVTRDEKGSKHALSMDPDFRDSLIEFGGILGGYGIYIDHIPPVIDIADSFNNIARGHMNGEHLVSVVPKNLFKYEGGLLKENREFDWSGKIRNLFVYDFSRSSTYLDDKINNFESMLNNDEINTSESMLDIEVASLTSELEIYVGSIEFLGGNQSLDNVNSFLSWMSLSFYNETGKDITTTPEDTEGLSKTEQDLVSLFNAVKNKFVDKPENSEWGR